MKEYNKVLSGVSIIALALICLVSLTNAEMPQQVDCTKEISQYITQINTCNISLNESMNSTDYYKNLSDYYKNLYESKEFNVTHKEIIILNQQINNLNMTINDIKAELSFLKLTLKISIPIISVTFISLWGFSLYLRRKIKEKNEQ
jgi:uncharacterized protein YpmS